MTADDRVMRLIRSLSAQEAPLVIAALWDALMYVRPTNQTPDEWASWLEQQAGKLRQGGTRA